MPLHVSSAVQSLANNTPIPHVSMGPCILSIHKMTGLDSLVPSLSNPRFLSLAVWKINLGVGKAVYEAKASIHSASCRQKQKPLKCTNVKPEILGCYYKINWQDVFECQFKRMQIILCPVHHNYTRTICTVQDSLKHSSLLLLLFVRWEVNNSTSWTLSCAHACSTFDNGSQVSQPNLECYDVCKNFVLLIPSHRNSLGSGDR